MVTMISLEPGPTGREERDLEVLFEGSRTAAMAMVSGRAR
jgi:hypothetical protein